VADSRLRQTIALIEGHVSRLVPNAKFVYGSRGVAMNSAPPRVVWVDDETETEQLGPPTDASALHNERAIHGVWSRTVAAHCWAADEALAEGLIELVSWAIVQELGPTALPFQVVRVPVSWASTGVVCTLVFTVAVPMFEPTSESPTVRALTTAFDSTDSTTTDGQLDAGEG
jgi:hypothetical protein